MSQQLTMKHGDKLVYSPRTASIYFGRGDIAERDFDKPLDFIGIKKLATMVATPKKFVGKIESINAGQMIEHTEFSIKYNGVVKDGLKRMAARNDLIATVQENGFNAKGLMAAQQLQQLEAASGISGIGQEEVSPIRVIPLIRKILGMRPNIFFVEQGFSTVNVEKLDARIPEQDTRTGQVQMNPLE
ncbi:hypothetical protein LCGC14_3115450, partial [marine sediment metagenome]